MEVEARGSSLERQQHHQHNYQLAARATDEGYVAAGHQRRQQLEGLKQGEQQHQQQHGEHMQNASGAAADGGRRRWWGPVTAVRQRTAACGCRINTVEPPLYGSVWAGYCTTVRMGRERWEELLSRAKQGAGAGGAEGAGGRTP